jgi:phosphonopyruvate decarboxylase
MLLLIGWRGAPGVSDEPQHQVQGRQTLAMLASMEIPAYTLPADNEQAKKVFADALAVAKSGSRPVALLAPPKTFSGTKAVASTVVGATAPTREEAIGVVLEAVAPGDAIVSTTGYTSRELYELREKLGHGHEKDFLTVGSMGHALAIAQGIAAAQPKRTVWCLDGDGAALMHLGTQTVSAALGLSNLRHVLLNNSVHDSVGGQPTSVSQGKQSHDFVAIARAVGYSSVASASTAAELSEALQFKGASAPGPAFVEANLSLGTRDDLGRPKKSTNDAKAAFMGHLAA